MRKVLIESGINYVEVANEAAFCGVFAHGHHRRHQVRARRAGTSPCPLVAVRKDFGLTYRDKDNSNKTPLCIHRAPLDTHERFIGGSQSHASSRRRLHAGNFPLWLAPDRGFLCATAQLAQSEATTYPSAMSTISVSDLQKKPAKQWLKSAGKDDLVITSKGQPVAVLMRIAAASVESTRALVRSVRALQAQTSLQQAAAASGAAELSMSDIDAEIAASRRARRRK